MVTRPTRYCGDPAQTQTFDLTLGGQPANMKQRQKWFSYTSAECERFTRFGHQIWAANHQLF